jgi:hypothetical protein
LPHLHLHLCLTISDTFGKGVTDSEATGRLATNGISKGSITKGGIPKGVTDSEAKGGFESDAL